MSNLEQRKEEVEIVEPKDLADQALYDAIKSTLVTICTKVEKVRENELLAIEDLEERNTMHWTKYSGARFGGWADEASQLDDNLFVAQASDGQAGSRYSPINQLAVRLCTILDRASHYPALLEVISQFRLERNFIKMIDQIQDVMTGGGSRSLSTPPNPSTLEDLKRKLETYMRSINSLDGYAVDATKFLEG
jgi:hypothetical protein